MARTLKSFGMTGEIRAKDSRHFKLAPIAGLRAERLLDGGLGSGREGLASNGRPSLDGDDEGKVCSLG